MSAVYALYPDPDAAQRAVNGLYAAGVAEAEVIVMSGEPWESLERHFGGLPVAGYLGKPFNVGRILEALAVLAQR